MTFKILKVEYLSNHTQIWNLTLDDQTIFYTSLEWKRPLMEDDRRCKYDLKACRMWLMNSYGEVRGKLRGNLECGSAQPSLFYPILISPWYDVPWCHCFAFKKKWVIRNTIFIKNPVVSGQSFSQLLGNKLDEEKIWSKQEIKLLKTGNLYLIPFLALV